MYCCPASLRHSLSCFFRICAHIKSFSASAILGPPQWAMRAELRIMPNLPKPVSYLAQPHAVDLCISPAPLRPLDKIRNLQWPSRHQPPYAL